MYRTWFKVLTMAGGDSPAEICVDSTGKKQLKTKKKTKKPKCQVASADSHQ